MDDFSDAFRAAKEQFDAGVGDEFPPLPPPYTDAPEHWTGETVADIPEAADAESLWSFQQSWDESKIPVRPWVVPSYLMAGSVTVLSGQGGGGKSSIVVAWTLALALGRPIGDFRPYGPVVSVNYNVEDDHDEQLRRYTAGLHAIGCHVGDIEDRMVMCGPTTIGTLFERDPVIGRVFPTPAMEALEHLCISSGAKVLVCDPLAELHNAEENDNTAMRSVVAAFRGLASRLGVAVLILHHDRKGASTPGDMDRVRGASAISGAVRVMVTLSVMTDVEAGKFGIQPNQRRRHFRIDGAKSNYAIATDAEWWRLSGYEIGNGENIAACLPWSPPSPFGGLSMLDCVTILELLDAGTAASLAWGATKQSGADWAGTILQRPEYGKTEGQAETILKAWAKEEIISIADLPGPRRGHARKAFDVNLEKVAEMRQGIRGGMPSAEAGA